MVFCLTKSSLGMTAGQWNARRSVIYAIQPYRAGFLGATAIVVMSGN